MARTCLLIIVACWGCRTAADIERDYAKTLAPSSIRPSVSPAPADLRVVRVRVLADHDYRAQVLRWRETVVAQLERASALVGPAQSRAGRATRARTSSE